MCDGFSEIALGVGALAAVGGTAISYTEGQAASAAAETAQQQASEAQNTAFMARQTAAQQQLADQTSINNKAASNFTANQTAQQNAQEQELNDRQTALTGINNQEQSIADQTNQVVQKGVAGASGTALAGAQSAQVAQQQAMNAPNTQEAAASNPLGAADSGVTQDAMDASQGAAAKYVKNYGDTLATLSGYNAPIALANNQATAIGTNLMPLAAQDNLLKSGAPAILAPSTTAYQQTGAYGAAANQANQINQQGALQLAADQASNAGDLANLGQTDSAAIIQGNLSLAQQRAATLASLGTGLTSLGNAGLQYAGSQGAFNGLFGGSSLPNGGAATIGQNIPDLSKVNLSAIS